MNIDREPEQVFETVAGLIREIIGDDAGLGPALTLETSFHEDLALESIELVALTDKVRERYGDRADLVGWLAGKDLDAILALRIGDLVERVERCR